MIIPFSPIGSFSFKVNLTMDQAIAIRGRDLPLKHELVDGSQVTSFRYHPSSSANMVHRTTTSGMMVYMKYETIKDGLSIKVVVLPHSFIPVFFTLWFSLWIVSRLVGGSDLSMKGSDLFWNLAPLIFGIVYFSYCWREILGIKRSIADLFGEFQH